MTQKFPHSAIVLPLVGLLAITPSLSKASDCLDLLSKKDTSLTKIEKEPAPTAPSPFTEAFSDPQLNQLYKELGLEVGKNVIPGIVADKRKHGTIPSHEISSRIIRSNTFYPFAVQLESAKARSTNRLVAVFHSIRNGFNRLIRAQVANDALPEAAFRAKYDRMIRSSDRNTRTLDSLVKAERNAYYSAMAESITASVEVVKATEEILLSLDSASKLKDYNSPIRKGLLEHLQAERDVYLIEALLEQIESQGEDTKSLTYDESLLSPDVLTKIKEVEGKEGSYLKIKGILTEALQRRETTAEVVKEIERKHKNTKLLTQGVQTEATRLDLEIISRWNDLRWLSKKSNKALIRFVIAQRKIDTLETLLRQNLAAENYDVDPNGLAQLVNTLILQKDYLRSNGVFGNLFQEIMQAAISLKSESSKATYSQTLPTRIGNRWAELMSNRIEEVKPDIEFRFGIQLLGSGIAEYFIRNSPTALAGAGIKTVKDTGKGMLEALNEKMPVVKLITKPEEQKRARAMEAMIEMAIKNGFDVTADLWRNAVNHVFSDPEKAWAYLTGNRVQQKKKESSNNEGGNRNESTPTEDLLSTVGTDDITSDTKPTETEDVSGFDMSLDGFDASRQEVKDPKDPDDPFAPPSNDPDEPFDPGGGWVPGGGWNSMPWDTDPYNNLNANRFEKLSKEDLMAITPYIHDLDPTEVSRVYRAVSAIEVLFSQFRSVEKEDGSYGYEFHPLPKHVTYENLGIIEGYLREQISSKEPIALPIIRRLSDKRAMELHFKLFKENNDTGTSFLVDAIFEENRAGREILLNSKPRQMEKVIATAFYYFTLVKGLPLIWPF